LVHVKNMPIRLPIEIARLEGTGLDPSEVASRVFDICSLDTDPIPFAPETSVPHKVVIDRLMLIIQDTSASLHRSAFRIATATSLRGYLMAKQEFGTKHVLTLDMSYLHASTLFYTIANVESYAKQTGLLRAAYSFAYRILEDMISMRGWNQIQTVGIAAIVASLANIVCREDVGCNKETTKRCAENLANMACDVAKRNGYSEWIPLACRNPALWESFESLANPMARMESIRTERVKRFASQSRAKKYRDELKRRQRSPSPIGLVPHIDAYRKEMASRRRREGA
jgi:hypothetical protein